MNILFVNYGDLRSNSINHIAPYANELSAIGHSCTVVTNGETKQAELSAYSPLFPHYSHQQMREGKELFADAKPADIIHAWTPREVVRKSVQKYLDRHPETRLIVHLEDNEAEILESAYQNPIETLVDIASKGERFTWNEQLCHPIAYREFLAQADGITVLRPSLKRLLPTPKRWIEIRPIVALQAVTSPESKGEIREALGIDEQEKIIVFPGGITSNNRSDVRDLFLAVKLINDLGTPCRLIKTGPNCSDLLGSFAFPLDAICLDLGYVPREKLNKLLQAADVLIQPGKRTPFNEDRFPCKIPEFLASSTPCIIPSMYSHSGYTGEPLCLYLETSAPREIADLALQLLSDPEQGKSLATSARAYVEEYYGPDKNRATLEEFYVSIRNSNTQNRNAVTTLRSRSIDTENNLHAEIERLQRELTGLKNSTERIAKENQELREEKERLSDQLRRQDDRVQRMRDTFSWQVTAPLRSLRRRFLDMPQTTEPTQASGDPAPEQSETPTPPPPNHPSYHKDYYLFVQADEKRIKKILQSPPPIPPARQPKISILLPVYNVAEKWLRKCIDSVFAQNYTNWELCIADDASSSPHVRETIDHYLKRDNRVKAVFRKKNGHISQASNSAYTLATGDYIALLDHDDELAPHALMRVAERILENPDAKLIYSDEDKIDENGLRHGPHFKSDWNYDLFLGCNMISHLGVYSRKAFEKVGGFRTTFEGAQDWDLALRITETLPSNEIEHIPEILYHWRNIEDSTAHSLSSKSYATSAQKRAIESHLSRINVNATVESVDGFDWKVNYPLPSPAPRVSIIIPTKDRIDLLEPCLDSILSKTDYTNYEIVIIDNDSQDPETHNYLTKLQSISSIRILKDDSPFNFSRINNGAIATCSSELICLLNNDTEVITSNWLREMAQHAVREEIGTVGAKLLFPHDHVQHGGVIMGIGGVAAHAFKFLHKTDDGHIHRAHLVSAYSATTGACMMFRKRVWESLEGFDEDNLPISYNDVDFCLRSNLLGLRTIVTPFAMLYHKESESRGSPLSTPIHNQQFDKESEYMMNKWRQTIQRDPYYNPNFSKDFEDFRYAWSSY